MNYLLFGILLKRHRREKHLTQAQMAQKMGMGLKDYIRFESAQNEPRGSAILAAGRATGIAFMPHDLTTWVDGDIAARIIGEAVS